MTSKFSQQHYNAIADALREIPEESLAKRHIIDALVKLFEQDNPKFSEQLFRVACKGD